MHIGKLKICFDKNNRIITGKLFTTNLLMYRKSFKIFQKQLKIDFPIGFLPK